MTWKAHNVSLYVHDKFGKCQKPNCSFETNTTGNKFPNAFLISLNASQRKSLIAREDFTKISWAVDVLDALQLRGNNANHMFAYIFEIILRACEDMENVNTVASTYKYTDCIVWPLLLAVTGGTVTRGVFTGHIG